MCREGADGIDEVLVEIANSVLYLAHARASRPVQAEVDGEIGLDFVLILASAVR